MSLVESERGLPGVPIHSSEVGSSLGLRRDIHICPPGVNLQPWLFPLLGKLSTS